MAIKLLRYWILGLLLFVGLGAHAQTASDPAVRAELERLLESRRNQDGHIGLVAAVAFPDGSIWEAASGWSDPVALDPIRTDHQMAFGSITKTFVAAVVFQLVDEGVLSLDDTVGQYAGPFTFVNSGITIRQLLGHTSGVYNYTNHPNRVLELRADLTRVWTPEEMLVNFLGPPLFFAGQGGSYSNSNFLILHTVIEAATGNTLGDEIRTRLIRPLGLSGTTFGGDEPPNGEVPVVWSDINGDGTLDNFSELYLATSHQSARAAPGSLFSTVSDIVRWAQILFHPSTFSDSVRQQMLEWHTLTGVNETWTGFGLSVQQFQFAGVEMWGHTGWVNGSRAMMAYSPEYGFSFSAVDNNAVSNHYAFAADLAGYLSTLDLTSTAVDELPGETGLQLYPNPVERGGVLSIEGVTDGRLLVVDILGRVVRDESASEAQLDVSDLSPGTYFVRVEGLQGAKTSTFVVR